MSHIARVGSRSPRVRAGVALIYAALVLGAVTTLYPFLLMVSIGAKSQVDYNEYGPRALVPRYFFDDSALYKKYLEDRYANNVDDLNAAHNTDYARVADATPPSESDILTVRQAESWAHFTEALSLLYKKAGFGEHDNAPSLLLTHYREHCRAKFGGDIAALNKAWTEENDRFETVVPPFERAALRDWTPDVTNPKVVDYAAFKQTLPPQFLVVVAVDPLFRRYLREDVYEDDLDRLNRVWSTQFRAWNEVGLPAHVPQNTGQRSDWETFVRTKYPLRFLRLEPGSKLQAAWQAYLAPFGVGAALPTVCPETLPAPGLVRNHWARFVAQSAPMESLFAASAENLWRGGNDIAELAPPPQALVDWQFTRANASTLRREFATRNFRHVAGYILLHGRAVTNTVLFCLLAIAGALVVNPLCAYALSRYPLPYTYQVLLFLLATMAFPAEVAMIPNFLLLRDLGLLNTFAALVLPGLASGFSIFLLKGFFDSLPKELYEAGILDGATEGTMFRRITVPLSLPIFSVIALNAFTGAYGAFLFALVVCQDQRMWTLMVWLYNLQDTAPQYVIMAALTLAAIPTLLVFLLAQKVILRGIILPSFK